ncbi:MAG: hypothetical protein HYX72_11915 [Acidobacteria bacterium]|nr:hypothetical protein [Acidobacteriota bacterium]
METDFTYINTVHTARQRDVNLQAPTVDAVGRTVFKGPRPYEPKFFIMQITESAGRSLYRGFTTSFKVRRPRFTFDAYYTLSWKYSSDDIEQNYSAIAYDNAANLKNEYNYSATDERHQFIGYGLYTLPFQFEVSSTSRLTSARPFDLMTMWDYNGDQQLNDRPIVNGTVMPRNAFRNLPFYDISLRFQRRFMLPNEKGRLTASVEFFNLFGFDNVQIGHPHMMYGPGSEVQNGKLVSVPPPTFNQLRDASGRYYRDNIPGDPFQAQFGLRFEF